MVNWRELHVTEEEQKKIQEVIDSGAGKTLPKEKLEEFKTGHEESFMISTEAGDIRVYYYRPAGSEGKVLPAYLNLHGGGFVKGRRDQDTVLDRNYCEKTGWAVIDIDYIPAPTVRYPGQVYQTYGVLQYCTDQANAEKLGIDPECIVLGGHSAGGNLTAAATLMAIDRNGRLPKGIILDYAVLGRSADFSLVRIHLRTGRTHQIRVQFASRGMPLVGERKYSTLEDPCEIALWSHKIGFTHPATGKFMTFSQKPPEVYPWDTV